MERERPYQLEEVAGKEPEPLTEEQLQRLLTWDGLLAELFPKMEEDHRKAHEIKAWEFRQFDERR